MSRRKRRLLMIAAVGLVVGTVFSFAQPGPEWLGTVLAVLTVLSIIVALDWLRGRRWTR